MICPYHKSKLVYVDKFILGCTELITKNPKTWNCPHIQYTSAINPKEKLKHE